MQVLWVMPWKMNGVLYENGPHEGGVPWFSPTWMIYGNKGKLALVTRPIQGAGGKFTCSIPTTNPQPVGVKPADVLVGPNETVFMEVAEIASMNMLQWIIRHYTWAGVLTNLQKLPKTYTDRNGVVKDVRIVEVLYRQTAVTATLEWVP
jgi:hypothetical protein